MRVLRRFSAMVLQGVLVSAPLLSTSSLCGPGDGQTSHMDMAGMAIGDMTTQAPAGSGDSRSPRRDCSFPWLPMSCQAMTSCVPGAVVVEVTVVAASAKGLRDEPVWRNERLRSITRAPEPPPPRA